MAGVTCPREHGSMHMLFANPRWWSTSKLWRALGESGDSGFVHVFIEGFDLRDPLRTALHNKCTSGLHVIYIK